MVVWSPQKSDATPSKSGNAAAQPEIAFIDLKAQQARIRDRIVRALAQVLDHGQYIMGPEVTELERQLAAFTGARYAISCASGTDALLIAMMSLGLDRGDAVLCPSFTFTATPESIALLGGTPVFIDVDVSTFNVSTDGLGAGLDAARTHGLKPVGLIAVDLFGLPADYDALEPFARQNGLWLLADAAQSFGASRGPRKVGTFGTAAATSFFPAKPLGCYGDGGTIFTNESDIAERMESIRLHGKSLSGNKYDIDRIGLNGRLDTIQAAILLQKLAIFEEEVQLRQDVARRYSEGLSDIVETPILPEDAIPVWAQYTIRVPANRRPSIIAHLKSVGVPTAIYYPRPLHQQTAYRGFPVAVNGLANSERLAKEVFSLPMHPYLDEATQERIVRELHRACAAC